MKEPQLEIRWQESTETEEFLTRELSSDALTKGFEYKPSRFTVTIQEEGRLIAALSGDINWKWMYIKKLAVAASRQHQGLGSKLMDAAVDIAYENQCTGIWVDTFSFQSPEFYRRHQFVEVGRINDYPRDHARIIFQRRLS